MCVRTITGAYVRRRKCKNAILLGVDQKKKIAPTGNRTQGKRLEGAYVTTTPLVPDVSSNLYNICIHKTTTLLYALFTTFHSI